MSNNELFDYHHQIYMKYHTEMWIHSGTKEDDFYSHIVEKEVVIPPSTWQHPTEWSIFALLHEIGHIMTNTTKMKRYEQEYLATQWALDEAKRIGFKVKRKTIKTYQEYIFDWRERSIKLKAKSVLPKEALVLKY